MYWTNWAAPVFRVRDTTDQESCFDPGTLLRAHGGPVAAGAILEALQAGEEPPELWSRDPFSGRGVLLPVIAARRTRGRGVAIGFSDGSELSLTEGHRLALPHAQGVRRGGIPRVVEPSTTAGGLRVGDVLACGRVVTAIRPLGRIDAVRMWTARPGWLQTEAGVAVGSRWQEVLTRGWLAISEVNECGDCDLLGTVSYVESFRAVYHMVRGPGKDGDAQADYYAHDVAWWDGWPEALSGVCWDSVSAMLREASWGCGITTRRDHAAFRDHFARLERGSLARLIREDEVGNEASEVRFSRAVGADF